MRNAGKAPDAARSLCEKYLGPAFIMLGWVLAFATIITLDEVKLVTTFELAAFASALFGFGAGWCARGGRL